MSRKPAKGSTTTTIYHENWLLRKEGVKQWVEYWGVIRGKWLQFYERHDEYNRPQLRKTLEITPGTKCSLIKRNKNRFPFSIDNGNGVYYIKVDTELERYHWIISILCAALEKPKRDQLPDCVPDSMKETETFRKLTKQEKQELRNKETAAAMRPVRREPIPASEFTNKRRRKFAERRENKAKKKERKRLRNLGLDPDEYEQQQRKGGESDEAEEHHMQHHNEHERRGADNMTSLSMTSLRQNNNNGNRLTVEKRLQQREMMLGSSPNNLHKKTTEANNNSNSMMAVKAMIHPPSQQQKLAKTMRSKKESLSHYNRAFQGDDIIEELPTCPVELDGDDGLLPNMVFDDYSSSDGDSSNDENTTEEISLNSNNNESLINIFDRGDLDSLQPHGGGVTKGDVEGSRRGSATIMSHTVLSDDGDAKQYSTAIEQRTKRPTSAKQAPAFRTLMERPISPLNAKPLSPFLKPTSRPTSPQNIMRSNRKKSEDFARFLDSTSAV